MSDKHWQDAAAKSLDAMHERALAAEAEAAELRHELAEIYRVGREGMGLSLFQAVAASEARMTGHIAAAMRAG